MGDVCEFERKGESEKEQGWGSRIKKKKGKGRAINSVRCILYLKSEVFTRSYGDMCMV